MTKPDKVFEILLAARKRYKNIQKVQKPLKKVKKISDANPKDYDSIKGILFGANKEVKQFIKFLDGHEAFLKKTLTRVKFEPVEKPDPQWWDKYVKFRCVKGADDPTTRKALKTVLSVMTKYDQRLVDAKAQAIKECDIQLASAKSALETRKGVEKMIKGLKLMIVVSKNPTAAATPASLAIDLEPTLGRFKAIAKAHLKIHERVWGFSKLIDKELKNNRYYLNELRKSAAKQMAEDAVDAIGKGLTKIFA